jgi:hypothetical protein
MNGRLRDELASHDVGVNNAVSALSAKITKHKRCEFVDSSSGEVR